MKRFLVYLITLLTINGFISCDKSSYTFIDGHQKGYQEGNDSKEPDPNYIDKSLFNRARIFPGMVSEKEERIKDAIVPLDLDFVWIKNTDLKVSTTPRAVFSTGYYAPAGENIKIVIPAGIVGLTAQIGVHMDDLTNKYPLLRDPQMFTVKELQAGENYIRNPYGGLIWIQSTLSYKQTVNLIISGAVKSPDYVQGSGISQTEWLKEVELSTVPWLELRSKGFIVSVPRSLILRHKNELEVDQALNFWQDVFKLDYYKWLGLSENANEYTKRYPTISERMVLDIQPSHGYAHAGFPFVAQSDHHWFSQAADMDKINNTFLNDDGAWGTFHEIGHNYQSLIWEFGGLVETTCNLFVFKTRERLDASRDFIKADPNLRIPFESALAFTKDRKVFKSFDKPYLDNFIDEPRTVYFKLAFFLQLFNRAIGAHGEDGWDFMTYLNTKSRTLKTPLNVNQAKIDFVYRCLSEFTGRDCYRYFESWGLNVSISSRRAMRKLYPSLTQEIWQYDIVNDIGGTTILNPKYDLRNAFYIGTYYIPTGVTAPSDALAYRQLFDQNYANGISLLGGTGFDNRAFIIDLRYTDAVKGIYYSNPTGAPMIKALRISKSLDGINWQVVGEYKDLRQVVGTRIEIQFRDIQDAQYFKIEQVENNSNNNGNFSLGELGFYYLGPNDNQL